MEIGTIFNKNDYGILELLIVEGCNSPYKSFSTKLIIESSSLSQVKVRQVIKNFCLADFIKEGAKDSNNKTYFYTENGLSHYKQVFGYSDEDIEDLIYENNNNNK